MSTESPDPTEMGPTRPVAEHAWLDKLLGDWNVVSVMSMGPGEPEMTSAGKESVKRFGDLWISIDGAGEMPGGQTMEYRMALGYDVSFKEYRGCWYATVSSHLWKYSGELSPDGRMLTLSCVGPSFVNDGEMANYRDVHEIIDANTRTMTSYGEGEDGSWTQFLKATLTRA